MHFFAFAFAVMAMLLSAAAVVVADNAANCKKNGGVAFYNAINTFCAKTNMVVPSTYASNGVSNAKAFVRIQSNCSPAAWVPSAWCKEQFFQMCNQLGTDIYLGMYKKYGTDGCQKFIISAPGVNYYGYYGFPEKEG